MKKYTTEELINLGYKIENAKITGVDLSMADHGCMTLSLGLDGCGWGCVYGGAILGHGYLGAERFYGDAESMEFLMRIMDVVGVDHFNSMPGKYIRVATKGWGSSIEVIGNIIEDKWFDIESFFDEESND